MRIKHGLCRRRLAKHDVEPTVSNTRPCVTLHHKTARKVSDITFIRPIYTVTYTPRSSKLRYHKADTILLMKLMKTYDISVLKLLTSHDLPSLLCYRIVLPSCGNRRKVNIKNGGPRYVNKRL